MSPVDQVLAVAKQITTSGKTPSVALLKSRLGNSVPMPMIIQGLQRFKSLSKEEVDALTTSQISSEKTGNSSQTMTLEALYQQVQQLRAEQQQLIEKVATLESALQLKDCH